jgi:ABC-type nitrate/sulfonate/bicarbonate transport system substrate-binding protein
MKKISSILIIMTMFLMISLAGEREVRGAEKLQVGYSGISGDLAHLWIAKEAGLFEKYGLDVEPVYFKSGTNQTQSLTSGEIKLAQTATITSMRAMLAGADLIVIAGYMNRFPYIFYTSKDITKPEQLKGKKVAVSGFGTTSHASTVLALRELGLVPVKEVAVLQIGDQSARFSALEAGTIQGITVAPPLTLVAKKRGFYPMLDLGKSGPEWVQEGIIANRSFLKKNPEVVKTFMKGFIEGLKLIRTDKEKTVQLLARFMKLDINKDKEALYESYEHMKNLTEKKPYPLINGIKNQIELIAEDDAKAKTARPEQFLDLSILQELDKSGFIDSLYK